MANGVAQIKITGNVTEAIAALEALGIKAETTGTKVNRAFGDRLATASEKSGNALQKLGNALGNFGIPFSGSISKMGEKIEQADSKGKKFGQSLAAMGKVAAIAGVTGFAVVAGESVNMARNFQSSMTTLQTGAGELQSNMGTVKNGILNMMGQVGESSQQLISGMYMIESAGYHGKQGLDVLRAAAEGAKVGGADLQTVADGVTTALNDYKIPASQAALVTSKLVATVASGKTHMQDLSGALATVLPAASSAKISLDQVLGAMATMTAQGTPAADSATYLKQTILQLSNPSKTAKDEMAALGLSAIDVSSNLGKRGLTGTMEMLQEAIARKMGPSGIVLLQTMQAQSKASAALNNDYKLLGPSLGFLASGYARGTVSTKVYNEELKKLSPEQRKLMASVVSNTEAVDSQGKKLAGMKTTQETFTASLAKMVGGSRSMQAALELTGNNLGTFQKNVKNISGTTTEAGNHVKGWSDVQKDFNTQIDQAKGSVEALGIRFGLILIPVIEQAIQVITKIVNWFMKHKAVAEALAIAIGTILVAALAAWIAEMVVAAVTNPWVLVIAGIMLVVAGIVMLIKHWKEVWAFIKKYSTEIALAISILLGPIGMVIGAIILVAAHWKAVTKFFKDAAQDVVNFFTVTFINFWTKTLPDAIENAMDAVGRFFQRIWKDIWTKGIYAEFIKPLTDFFSTIMTTIGNGFLGSVNWFFNMGKRLATSLFNAFKGIGKAIWHEVTKYMPGSGIVGHALNAIGLAEGGIVTKPTLAMIGEAGYPEAVVPLKNGASVMGGYGNGVSPLPAGLSNPTGTGQGGMTNNFVFQTTADAQDIANETTWALSRLVS